MLRECIGKRNLAVYIEGSNINGIEGKGINGTRIIARVWEVGKRVHMHLFESGLHKLTEDDRIFVAPYKWPGGYGYVLDLEADRCDIAVLNPQAETMIARRV